VGKHQYVTCFRCGKQTGATHTHPVYGCWKCRASLPPEKKKELHDALIARNRAQREAAKDAEAAHVQLSATIEAATEPGAPIGILRSLEPPGRFSGPVTHKEVSEVAEQVTAAIGDRALVQRLVAEQDYVAAVDKAMAAHSAKLRRCECCFTVWHAPAPPYVETWDGKLFCVLCAFGVERCGACPVHNNVIYPEIAATVPRVNPKEYPPEVLGACNPALFD
jgi:hypothetical protein